MKNKILLLFLAVLFLIPSVAFAEETGETAVQTDATYEMAKALVEVISPDMDLPAELDATISRAQFTTAMVSLLGINLPKKMETGFADVPASDSAAASIGYAKQIGAVSSGTLFYPEDDITYMQAVKMIVATAGYMPQAEINGGYPNGYVLAAATAGLTNGVRGNSMNVRNAVVMFYNLLTADMMQQTGFGENVTYEVVRDKNILTENHKMYKVKGIVTANDDTALTSVSAKAGKDCISIGYDEYFMDVEADYLGYNVTAYYKDINSENHIVFINPEKNDEVTIKARDISKVIGQNFYGYEPGTDKEIKYSLYASYSLIWNGKARAAEDLSKYLKPESGSVKLVDNNRDGIYEVAFVENVKYAYISSIDAYNEKIFDRNDTNGLIDLSDVDCEYKVYDAYGSDKEEISLSDIQQDMLIAYTESEDHMLYQIQVCNDYVSGAVTGVDTENVEVTIDGTNYRLSYYGKKYYDIKAGSTGTFLQGLDGEITVFTSGESRLKYGWMMLTGKEGGVIGDTQIKLLTQDGKIVVYSLADKITVDGVGKTSSETEKLLANIFGLQSTDGDNARFIRYGLNNDGKINCLDTFEEAKNGSDFVYDKADKNNLTLFYKGSLRYKNTKYFSPSFHIDDATVCLVIPQSNARDDEKKYQAVNTSYFKQDINYTVAAFNVDASGRADAVLAVDISGSSSVALDNNSAIVEKKILTVNEDGQEVYELSLWDNGQFRIYYSDENDVDGTKKDIAELEPGDIIRYATNNQNEITAITKDYTMKSDTIVNGNGAFDGQLTYTRGNVFSFSNGYMNILKNMKDVEEGNVNLFSNLINYNVGGGKLVFVDVVSSVDVSGNKTVKRVKIYHAPSSSIVEYLTSGAEGADKVIVRTRYCDPKLAIIYKDIIE